MFHALRHRNFRLYLSGQFVSLIGTWMQQLATSWLVYRLTHSSLWLGIATFAAQVPTFVLGLFAGVVVDRANQHRLLVWTQALMGLQALALSLLTFYGKITLGELIGLSVFLGIVNAFDMPTRQAFVIRMIGDKQDLANAIALNSSVMNGTRLIGPAIAGVVIAAFGEGVCFFLNAVSYLAVLIALFCMHIDRAWPVPAHGKLGKSLREGLAFTFGFRPIGAILGLLSLTGLFGIPFMTLLPMIAGQTLHGDAHTLGIITAVSGLGALSSALYLAIKKNVLRLGRLIGLSCLMLGAGIVGLAFVRSLVFALPLLFITGLAMMLQMASSNTVIQTLVEDDKRGRVMSVFTLSLVGISPFGSLLIGSIAQAIGIPRTLVLCGVACTAGSLLYLRRIGGLAREVEPVYRRLGILKPSTGESSAPTFSF